MILYRNKYLCFRYVNKTMSKINPPIIWGIFISQKNHRKSSGSKNQSNYGLNIINSGYSQTPSVEY